jgi:hypothetical protein
MKLFKSAFKPKFIGFFIVLSNLLFNLGALAETNTPASEQYNLMKDYHSLKQLRTSNVNQYIQVTEDKNLLFCGLLNSVVIRESVKNKLSYFGNSDYSYRCEQVVLQFKKDPKTQKITPIKDKSFVIHPGGFKESLDEKDLELIYNEFINDSKRPISSGDYWPAEPDNSSDEPTSDHAHGSSSPEPVNTPTLNAKYNQYPLLYFSNRKKEKLLFFCGIFNSVKIKNSLERGALYYEGTRNLKHSSEHFCSEVQIYIKKDPKDQKYKLDHRLQSYVVDWDNNMTILKDEFVDYIVNQFGLQ